MSLIYKWIICSSMDSRYLKKVRLMCFEYVWATFFFLLLSKTETERSLFFRAAAAVISAAGSVTLQARVCVYFIGSVGWITFAAVGSFINTTASWYEFAVTFFWNDLHYVRTEIRRTAMPSWRTATHMNTPPHVRSHKLRLAGNAVRDILLGQDGFQCAVFLITVLMGLMLIKEGR